MKCKILFHLNHLGYGGTEKAILTFCQNLDRSRFEPILFVNHHYGKIKYLLDLLGSKLTARGKKRFIRKYINPLVRKPQFEETLGKENVHIGDERDFLDLISSVEPNIVHFNRGDWCNFLEKVIDKIPDKIKCVETNIFGRPAPEYYFDRLSEMFFISNWLIETYPVHGNKGKVLFLPVKVPANNDNLREQLSISEDTLVLGRIARPNLFSDDIFLIDAFRKLNNPIYHLIVVAASDELKDAAKDLEHVSFIEPTSDENVLSNFYNSLDLLLHRRIDGETFGMNIAEAMIHGKPVVSHLSSADNAQAELLNETEDGIVGFVAQENDIEQYAELIQRFEKDRELLNQAGVNAKHRAMRLYSERVLTKQLEDEYTKLISLS